MKHVTLRIETDDSPFNPRDEFDNLSTFYGPKGSRYYVGGKHDIEMYDYDLQDALKVLKEEKAIIVEFQSDAGTCYAVVKRDQLQDEYIKYGYSLRKALYWARSCAKGEIAEWLAYCNGEVYGYIVDDNEGNHLDSCWGFYDRDHCEQEGKDAAEHHENEIEQALQAEEQELTRRMELAVNG